MSAKTQTKSKPALSGFLKILKALLVSLIITFAGIIIFAFILKWASIPDSYIAPVNLVIKALSVFFGALVLTKGGSKGILNGVLFGLVYTLVSFVTFSILASSFVFGLGLVLDLAFALVVGSIGGIFGVNIKPRR